jgi:hypothetical protein
VNHLARKQHLLLEAGCGGGIARDLRPDDFQSDAGVLKKLILGLVTSPIPPRAMKRTIANRPAISCPGWKRPAVTGGPTADRVPVISGVKAGSARKLPARASFRRSCSSRRGVPHYGRTLAQGKPIFLPGVIPALPQTIPRQTALARS